MPGRSVRDFSRSGGSGLSRTILGLKPQLSYITVMFESFSGIVGDTKAPTIAVSPAVTGISEARLSPDFVLE